jgi:transforming growth factor-beta-induced protein
MNKQIFNYGLRKIILPVSALVLSFGVKAQTNVFDNVIAPSPNHTYLEAALIQQGLDVALKNNAATLTVFAPDDNAFLSLATALGTNITGLLALPNLTDILTYHVLGTTVPASAVTNGAIVQPLSTTNTLKLTKTAGGAVYVNQAKVTTADLTANNGVVHVLNGVLLPAETVADIAIDNGFSTLVTAVVTAELLPALTDPLSTLTVFAPTNAAFDNLATALGTNVNGLLALPNLADVLAYHVLGTEVLSSAVTNGAIVQPLSPTNTLKVTLTSTGNVFVNQAQVTSVDILADNGVVHVLNAVVLPVETVVDLAIDNGFTSLTAAVVKAELLPALTNPLASLTVFAPTNAAFDNLAAALGVDLNGVLAHPQLADILLYHVIGSEVLSTQLVNGPVATLNGQNVTIDLTNGVKVNASNVVLADVQAYNGVVHVIDAVLLPSLADLMENENNVFEIYPNPTTDMLNVTAADAKEFQIVNVLGSVVKSGEVLNNAISISDLENGQYFIQITTNNTVQSAKFLKQ